MTTPEDVIKQITGEVTGFDEMDSFSYVFYGCQKFGDKDANVNLEEGTVEVLADDGETVTKKFAITVTLDPIPID